MFPTFDVPPQHAETVGARKARKEREDGTRRSSTATSNSSGSARSAIASRQNATANSAIADSQAEKRSGFSWFGRSKKGIQEIATLPLNNKKTPTQSVRELRSESAPGPVPESLFPLPPPPPPPPQQEQSYDDRGRRQFLPPLPPHQLERRPPPLKSLPSLPSPPPSSGLPQAASLAFLSARDGSTDGRKSQHSTFSHTSRNPTATPTVSSSDHTTASSRSIFSQKTSYSEAPTEDSYNDYRPSFASNVMLEPVERGSRTGSRQGDHLAKASQAPFARSLAKMENAGARIIAARLSEEWEGLDDDESFQEVMFEKRLWALTAYQRLTQNKHLQSPAHELLSQCRPGDQRRILNLHGSLADGWMLATRYPTTTVYTISAMKSSKPPTSYPAPLNHHSLYLPSVSSASPFPNDYFDAIVSRSVSTILRNDEWARSFFDCMRILKPGGQIEILSIDAHMTSEGPQLANWVDEHLTCRLEAHGLSRLASDTVLDTLEIVGLENIRRARVALPAHSPKVPTKPVPPPSHTFGAPMPAPSSQDTMDTSRMMAFLGRHFYQDLFSNFMHPSRGEEWFWGQKDLRDECQRYSTKMVLTIACALKPAVSPNNESYLDI